MGNWNNRNEDHTHSQLPRALSQRAEWGFSNAAIERREQHLQNAARQTLFLARIIRRLLNVRPRFRPKKLTDEYHVEVE